MNPPESLFSLDEASCWHLAEQHDTPLFAYAAHRAQTRVERLRRVLPERVRLAYAVKANPFPSLLDLFFQRGLSFDVASGGELDRLQALGVPADRIFFAGPGKRNHEIEIAVDRGVRLQAEGIEDLRRIDAAARALGIDSVAVNLRVQPLGIEERGRILGGSGPSAFGVDEEDLPELLAQAADLHRVRIRGLHGFAASNERSAKRLLENHDRMLCIAWRMQQEDGLHLEQIDLGGGLGVPYAAHEEELDIDELGRGLERLLEENRWFRGELIIEPGRFLAAPCGVYLSRVVRTKVSRGESFAILEGGINHLLRPLLTGQPFPVKRIPPPLSAPVNTAVHLTTLAGPLCTALDRLGQVELPELQPGDLLAFGMTGAYAATEGMISFLDHPPAQELWWQGKTTHPCDRSAHVVQCASPLEVDFPRNRA